jgi:tetratricopeptide (TPR) repeat protein
MIALGLAAQGLGDLERAAAAYTEGAELARAGGYTWFLGIATGNLGDLALEQGDYAQARARLEEGLGLFRELGDERKIVEGLVNLGIVAAREGRSNEAEALLREGLEYAEELVDKELAIWCLTELAGLALSKGDAERAAGLTGAIETLCEETGHTLVPDQQRLSEQTRSALLSELGEEHLVAALALGRAMTLDQAVAYALRT